MALHVAAQNGRVEVIYHLIKAGCDVNAKNDVRFILFCYLLTVICHTGRMDPIYDGGVAWSLHCG